MKRVLLLSCLAGCAPAAPRTETASRPNIVLVMADDLGYSDLGCYGGEIPTPRLDALAAGGLRFTQFYNAARCCPTRASLLTGRYPHEVGIGHLNGPGTYPGDLARDVPTLPELLRKAGYSTCMAGKWHVTPWPGPDHNYPRRRGFDRFYGIIASIRSYYNPPSLMRDDEALPPPSGDYHFTDAVSDAAVGFVEEHDLAKPLFLYVAHAAPHWPIQAREADVARHLDRYRAGWDAVRAARHRRLAELGILAPRDERVAPWESAEPKEWLARRMAVYAAMVEQMDRGIGRILDALERRGMAKNTLVLFLSDNGGCAEEIGPEGRSKNFPLKTRDGRPIRLGNGTEIAPGPEDTYASYGLEWAQVSNTPFRLFKSFVHEGGIATPFIIRWPRFVPAGQTSSQVGHVIDLLPTCLEAAGGPLVGRSLLRPDPTPRLLFWEHEGNRAVRQGRWKLVAVHGGPWELYDLETDRTELSNHAAAEPERVRDLASQCDAWAARCGVKPWTEPQTPIGGRTAAGPTSTDVFVSGREGYHSFRIPSALVTPKGMLLAFCEGRKNGRSDTGDIDLLLRRSADGGATWGPMQVVWDDGPNTCGNPCPVVDRDTGTIWLLLTHNLGKDAQAKILDGTSEGTRTAWVARSDDDGLTWARPAEITRDVKKPDWTWYATGPGVGIQLRTGRLVVPCDHTVAGTKTETAHVIFSDDHGKTWKLGGSTDDKLGESQVAELADGALMINLRNHGSAKRERGVALSRDGGLTWEAATHDAALVEPQCQASLLRYSLVPTRLLFSNPASAKARERMTVRMSLDEGKTWPAAKEIHAGPAAYSCLAALADGSIGCLYEAGEKSAYEKIVFTRLTLEGLTEGK